VLFVTAVLCPHHEAFVRWCRANGYRQSGDGGESADGRWVACRVLAPADLDGLVIDRVDHALDFWRLGERDAVFALDELARSRLRRHQAPDGDRDGGGGRRGPRGIGR